MEKARRLNKEQDTKFISMAQHNASLKAKLDFIESKYDFSSNINNLNADDLKGLITTNTNVRKMIFR